MSTKSPDDDPLSLTADERVVLVQLLKLPEAELLLLMEALYRERLLEVSIYCSREQWLWIPWTTCLAGAILTLASPEKVVCIGGSLVLGAIAWLFVFRRMPGLKASYDALNARHKWVVALTENAPSEYLRMVPLGFRSRLLKVQQGGGEVRVLDDIHVGGFAYPGKLRFWTPVVFLLMSGLGILSILLHSK